MAAERRRPGLREGIYMKRDEKNNLTPTDAKTLSQRFKTEESQKVRKGNNSYGNIGTRKCQSCRNLKIRCVYKNQEDRCEKCARSGHYCGAKLLAKHSRSSSEQGDGPFVPGGSESREKFQMPWGTDWLPLILACVQIDENHSIDDAVDKLQSELERHIQERKLKIEETDIIMEEDDDFEIPDDHDEHREPVQIRDAGPVDEETFDNSQDYSRFPPISSTLHPRNILEEPNWLDERIFQDHNPVLDFSDDINHLLGTSAVAEAQPTLIAQSFQFLQGAPYALSPQAPSYQHAPPPPEGHYLANQMSGVGATIPPMATLNVPQPAAGGSSTPQLAMPNPQAQGMNYFHNTLEMPQSNYGYLPYPRQQ